MHTGGAAGDACFMADAEAVGVGLAIRLRGGGLYDDGWLRGRWDVDDWRLLGASAGGGKAGEGKDER